MDRPALSVFIFGGSFDPVHNGHIAIVRELDAALKETSRILFMPTNASPFKKHRPAAASDRLAMLRLALAGEMLPHLAWEISERELAARSPARTIDTLELLEKQEMQPMKISLIIGADHLSELEHWKRGSELMARYSFVVARRPGIDAQPLCESLQKKYRARFLLLNGPDVACSSSGIRQSLAEGKTAEAAQCLPQKVLDFIMAHKLYGSAA
ncbi:MAG: nicotinate (nicotinamide) nucleotide adenylyltransferase [Spirochaetales bacterium]|nr:nicotinate (nicotinamide) nucleotide adenylyltransferase [Spirochaetales bacterium]